jgi:hypothetical protein
VVSVKKVEQGYCFNLEDGSRAWSERLSNEAAIALAAIPTYGIETSHESILVELLELRRMGLVEITDEGEVVLPLTVSEIGRQVDKVLWDLQLQPVGTVKTFGRAPVGSVTDTLLSAHQRQIHLMSSGLWGLLASVMLSLGCQALVSLGSFVSIVIKGGGEPSKAAFGIMADPTGLAVQLSLVIAVPALVMLYMSVRNLRAYLKLGGRLLMSRSHTC